MDTTQHLESPALAFSLLHFSEEERAEIVGMADTMTSSEIAEILTWMEEPELLEGDGWEKPFIKAADYLAARIANDRFCAPQLPEPMLWGFAGPAGHA
ncbi:MAG TPA: hypothetical protein VF628_11200 [Allosphingosinicella sp.]|jgi:hypothetical protein